jgi:hypothetical protein
MQDADTKVVILSPDLYERLDSIKTDLEVLSDDLPDDLPDKDTNPTLLRLKGSADLFLSEVFNFLDENPQQQDDDITEAGAPVVADGESDLKSDEAFGPASSFIDIPE